MRYKEDWKLKLRDWFFDYFNILFKVFLIYVISAFLAVFLILGFSNFIYKVCN